MTTLTKMCAGYLQYIHIYMYCTITHYTVTDSTNRLRNQTVIFQTSWVVLEQVKVSHQIR